MIYMLYICATFLILIFKLISNDFLILMPYLVRSLFDTNLLNDVNLHTLCRAQCELLCQFKCEQFARKLLVSRRENKSVHNCDMYVNFALYIMYILILTYRGKCFPSVMLVTSFKSAIFANFDAFGGSTLYNFAPAKLNFLSA